MINRVQKKGKELEMEMAGIRIKFWNDVYSYVGDAILLKYSMVGAEGKDPLEMIGLEAFQSVQDSSVDRAL